MDVISAPSSSRSFAFLVVNIFFHMRIRPDMNSILLVPNVKYNVSLYACKVTIHVQQVYCTVLPLSNGHLIVWPVHKTVFSLIY